MKTLVTVTFRGVYDAYAALAVLSDLHTQGQVDMINAAIVMRDEHSRIHIEDATDGTAPGPTAGTIGLLIEVLRGPLGVLLSGAAGAVIRSHFDAGTEADISALSAISLAVTVARPAVLAEVIEPTTDAINAAMTRLNGTVGRHSIDDVKAEMAAAEEAQCAATRAARRQLLELRTWLRDVERGSPGA